MDTSSTFQFVVDELVTDWHVIAPDWRGYGDSEMLNRPYWFPDYYADLDALLEHYSPRDSVILVGHSMGANIASAYASIRPDRVSKLVMLDFMGLQPGNPNDAINLLKKWVDSTRSEPKSKKYTDLEQIALRLRLANPRLTETMADFLAQAMCRRTVDGSYVLACDPWHKVSTPYVYHIEDAKALWRNIVAPVLEVIAEGGYVMSRFGNQGEIFETLSACFRDFTSVTVPDAGHNVHHDQPVLVAQIIEDFLLNSL